ncbi:hypothetical protein PR048_024859 [Dryococelus australis]|uniref:Uncharacterized protein n=1 Tax=Dryococelus australis TaxID=614101 RepID=A0ABQ9GPU0_9NEOP|nr:hypothetical protein PR048_024859 [Dryococelus australis]
MVLLDHLKRPETFLPRESLTRPQEARFKWNSRYYSYSSPGRTVLGDSLPVNSSNPVHAIVPTVWWFSPWSPMIFWTPFQHRSLVALWSLDPRGCFYLPVQVCTVGCSMKLLGILKLAFFVVSEKRALRSQRAHWGMVSGVGMRLEKGFKRVSIPVRGEFLSTKIYLPANKEHGTLREVAMAHNDGHGCPIPICRDACLLPWIPSPVGVRGPTFLSYRGKFSGLLKYLRPERRGFGRPRGKSWTPLRITCVENGAAATCKSRGERERPEKTRKSTETSATYPTCDNLGDHAGNRPWLTSATSCGYNSNHPVWHALFECFQDIHRDSSPFLLQSFHELSNGFWPRLTSPHPAIQFVPKMFYRVEVGALGGPVQSATLLSAYHRMVALETWHLALSSWNNSSHNEALGGSRGVCLRRCSRGLEDWTTPGETARGVWILAGEETSSAAQDVDPAQALLDPHLGAGRIESLANILPRYMCALPAPLTAQNAKYTHVGGRHATPPSLDVLLAQCHDDKKKASFAAFPDVIFGTLGLPGGVCLEALKASFHFFAICLCYGNQAIMPVAARNNLFRLPANGTIVPRATHRTSLLSYSYVGIVPADVGGFPRDLPFPHPFTTANLHTHLNHQYTVNNNTYLETRQEHKKKPKTEKFRISSHLLLQPTRSAFNMRIGKSAATPRISRRCRYVLGPYHRMYFRPHQVAIIGSQDLDVQSRPNLITHSLLPYHSRSDYSPPTTANQARIPAESLPNFCLWGSRWTMPLVGGFSRRSLVSLRLCILALLRTSQSRAAQITPLLSKIKVLCFYSPPPPLLGWRTSDRFQALSYTEERSAALLARPSAVWWLLLATSSASHTLAPSIRLSAIPAASTIPSRVFAYKCSSPARASVQCSSSSCAGWPTIDYVYTTSAQTEGLESARCRVSFISTWFSEITPGVRWDGSLTKAMADSFPIPLPCATCTVCNDLVVSETSSPITYLPPRIMG